MYRKFDETYGFPLRLYRNPRDIHNDMREIRIKIAEANERLNIRGMLVDILSGERADCPEKLVPELEEAISDAKEALHVLDELADELSRLEAELAEVKWVLGK